MTRTKGNAHGNLWDVTPVKDRGLRITGSYWDVLGNVRKYYTSNNEPRVDIPQDSFSRAQYGSV